MRAGAQDALDKEAPLDALVAQMQGLLENRPVAPRNAETGKLVAVLGARRGVGATSFASAIALECAHAAISSHRTLLLDFGAVPAPIPDILGLQPTYCMTDAVLDLGRIDAALIEGAFLRLASPALFVLPTANSEESFDSVGTSELLNLATVLQTYFRTVVADLNPIAFPSLSDGMFLDADHTFLCCDQTLPTIHSAALILERLRSITGKEPQFDLVITRYNRKLRPTPQEICDTLGSSGTPLIIPDDRLNVDRARNAGKPLTWPGAQTPFARAVREIATATLPGLTGASKSRHSPRSMQRGAALFRSALGLSSRRTLTEAIAK